MITSPYNLSFTTGGLLLGESLIVANEYFITLNWNLTVEKVKKHNLLQARTESTGKRLLHEIIARLKMLNDDQLILLKTSSHLDQQHLLWLAICKRFQFLKEFSIEVIRDKFLQLDLVLAKNDFDEFLEGKAVWHPEIDQLTASTRTKLRQVTFRMLREADLISTDNVIQPVILSHELARAIQSDSPTQFAVFPVSESDIRGILL